MDAACDAVQLGWVLRRALGLLSTLEVEDTPATFTTRIKAGGVMDVVERWMFNEDSSVTPRTDWHVALRTCGCEGWGCHCTAGMCWVDLHQCPVCTDWRLEHSQGIRAASPYNRNWVTLCWLGITRLSGSPCMMAGIRGAVKSCCTTGETSGEASTGGPSPAPAKAAAAYSTLHTPGPLHCCTGCMWII